MASYTWKSLHVSWGRWAQGAGPGVRSGLCTFEDLRNQLSRAFRVDLVLRELQLGTQFGIC